MYFYWGPEVTFLFEGWRTETRAQYAIVVALSLVWGVAHEYVVALRHRRGRGAGGVLLGSGSRAEALSGEDEAGVGHDGSGDDESRADSMVESLLAPPPPAEDGRPRRAAAFLGRDGHALATALYSLQLVSSYLLMLVIMTFNAGLFLAIVCGLSIGFFLFGLERSLTSIGSSDLC